MDLFLALINVPDDFMNTSVQFMEMAGVSMNLQLQNNITAYKPQFYEATSRVGLMVQEVAEAMGLEEDESVVRILFEEQ